MQLLTMKYQPNHPLTGDLVYLIYHLQSPLFIVCSFLLIVFLINTHGLESSNNLVMFLLGGIIGIVTPLGGEKQ
jgi:hypothetical protein